VIQPEFYSPSSPSAPPVAESRPVPVSILLKQWIADLTNAQLVTLLGGIAFVLSAWPLLLVDLPPFQELPNHIATAHVLEHPELFPQLALRGLFESNRLLSLWLHLLGDQRLFLAARLFTGLSIAVTALALPAFFLRFGGRRAMPMSMLFAWPLVHGFFVSMGFLNFVVAFGSSLLLLVLMDQQQENPTWRRGVGIGLFACFIWYAHPFPLAVVVALAACEVLQGLGGRSRIAAAAAMLLPLVPAGLLSVAAAWADLARGHGFPAVVRPEYQNVWSLVTHLWRDASGALTRWGSMSVIPALLLPIFAWRGRHRPRRFFSNPVIVGLVIAYCTLPLTTTAWRCVNCRLVPFLWVGVALCVPARLPRRLPAVLIACAVSFSAVLGLDYLRLDADRAEFTAGLNAVPRGAKLMPLVFEHEKTADFVASLANAAGYYTAEKDAVAPLASGAVMSELGPSSASPIAVGPTFDRFAERYATSAGVCKALGQPAVDAFCTAIWRDGWTAFWKAVQPRFTHLLTWGMPAETRKLIPLAYRLTFAAGDLEIYARETPGETLGPVTTAR
jgi:hypothetical protein